MSEARSAVVTGGAGFIGSTLVDRLLGDGWQVTAIDCLEPYYPREIKERNLAAARTHLGFHLVEVDTRDRAGIREAIAAAHPVVVIDFAARAGVRPSLQDPALYIDINVRGLQHTLSATAEVGARFVFASSSSVYGIDPRRPFREDQMRCSPESPYGATKIAGEALVLAHHATTGLPVGIARLFTVYGPRQRPDLAIHKFARLMLSGDPVELYDHGKAVRDYTYVDDVVEAFVRLIETSYGSLVVNIGSHRPIPTTQVVDELERALGVPARRVLLPPQAGDVPETYADITRARERLGWIPDMAFEAGIDSFCGWLKREETDSPAGARAD